MNRRSFIVSTSAAVLGTLSQTRAKNERANDRLGKNEMSADVGIVGGGLGGCAAALAALRNGLTVVMTEQTDWIGGQLTSQAVPPDEHQWIESHGCTASYRALRNGIRDYYRSHYPLTEAARAIPGLNPGDGAVSRLCHEPGVAVAVLEALLAPFVSQGKLRLMLETRPISAEVTEDVVRTVKLRDLRSGRERVLSSEER